ncbi:MULTISPECIES: hypothetical protein [unclassified Rhizobium]|uniref:hypothetical protein n=1 Tax=unclassified Rhizobium TaxID=2613769 RepID=UPI00161E2263|nr:MULTISPECIES: hypothetical protein [unclassified Rhizobium]MBB3317789.1 hypothetical protein [Rhizobium sp. BK181]MBB3542096.1 hypothetical protein [Rhizobium sp. BK399]MCS3740323.1 hypothetical protein [Rhizobium sp. BK661]MCS4094220.1 hypothetical protein [Rhizobium sp. BK176]
MSDLWPWILLAGLGAFHGLNPAMGWLFAVALGVHRQSSAVVIQAVPAIALGHAVSIALVAGAVVAAGLVVNEGVVRMATGGALIAWAIWHHVFGHGRRVRIGLRTGLFGLACWSFLMATAHGAGLMVLPALMPLCLTESPVPEIGDSAAMTIAAVGVHTLAMLAVTGLVALGVYRWVGLEILRSAWINVDFVWTLVLIGTGALLLIIG